MRTARGRLNPIKRCVSVRSDALLLANGCVPPRFGRKSSWTNGWWSQSYSWGCCSYWHC